MRVRVPGDKSITQRALILGAMASGESVVQGALMAEDPLATARALQMLGAGIRGLEPASGDGEPRVRVEGRGYGPWISPRGSLDLKNSGTGARLLMGALAAREVHATIKGDASLSRRPMRRVAAPLRAMGADIRWEGRPGMLPARVSPAKLRGVSWRTRIASAQVKSAILLAAVSARASVQVTEPRRSRDHTERMLRAMGAELREEETPNGEWMVRLSRAPSELASLDLVVPGDFSSAAFLMAWAALLPQSGAQAEGRRLVIEGVGLNPTRTGFLDAFRRMGARVAVKARRSSGGEPLGDIEVRPSLELLQGIEVGPREIPAMIDEIPVLAVLASRAKGETRIRGAEELRAKESDRLSALASNLAGLGASVAELPDGLDVRGSDRELAGEVDSFDDHRIAMAFGALRRATGCHARVRGANVVDVSYPGYWEQLDSLEAGLG